MQKVRTAKQDNLSLASGVTAADQHSVDFDGDEVLFPPRQGRRVNGKIQRGAPVGPLTDEDIENALEY